MATFVGLHNKTYLGHLDLTGVTDAVDFGPLTRAFQPSTTFADGGWSCVKPGLISGEARVAGFQDFDVDALDDEISIAQLGSQYALTVIPNPTGTVTAGDAAWLSRCLIGSETQPWVKGEMARVEMGLPYDTAIARGVVLHPSAARTATGNGSIVALAGPTATQRLYASLHVTAYTGLTSLTVKIASDDAVGFTTPTDRLTFTAATGTTSQFTSVAGSFSSETHLRVTYTIVGTGSATFTVAVGVL